MEANTYLLIIKLYPFTFHINHSDNRPQLYKLTTAAHLQNVLFAVAKSSKTEKYQAENKTKFIPLNAYTIRKSLSMIRIECHKY